MTEETKEHALIRRLTSYVETGAKNPAHWRECRLRYEALAYLNMAVPQGPASRGIQDAPDTEGRAGSALPKDGLKYKCPKCGEMSLQVKGMTGEDDHGQIEGEAEWCEKCGYMDEWAARC